MNSTQARKKYSIEPAKNNLLVEVNLEICKDKTDKISQPLLIEILSFKRTNCDPNVRCWRLR